MSSNQLQCPHGKQCSFLSDLESLIEKQYRIDHDFLMGPVARLLGIAEIFRLYIKQDRWEEAKMMADKLQIAGEDLKEGIRKILEQNVLENVSTETKND